MVDSLYCLRHHIVIGSDNDDGDISEFCTTGTHCGERLVTRSVEECYLLSRLCLHLVCSDMLGDTTGLACYDVSASDEVEKLSLTMVNVTHDGDDRSSWYEVLRVVRLVVLSKSLLNIDACELDGETELLSNDGKDLSVKTLVDGDEHSEAHTC